MSIALGRSHAYLSNGIISNEFLKGLERYYGISGKDIEAKLIDGSKGSESVTEGPKAVDYDELYKCIYGAVYQAVKKALNEWSKHLWYAPKKDAKGRQQKLVRLKKITSEKGYKNPFFLA